MIRRNKEIDLPELPVPVSVEEALSAPSLDIHVPEGSELTVGPFEKRHAEAFRLAEVRSFEDLHRLGFIREEITEDEMTAALRHDERLFREAGRKFEAKAAHRSGCDCADHQPGMQAAVHRRQYQDHLIELLQPLSRDLLGTDNSLVRHHYHHARAWLSRPGLYLIGIISLNNIDIEDRATLTMTPTVRALYANEINIGKFGVLRFTSGGVHVRCNVLNGPQRWATEVKDISKYMKGLGREPRWEVQE